MAWTQLFIKGEGVNTRTITHAEPLIERWGALPVAPQGTPIKNEQGEYEIRILESVPIAVKMVRAILEGQYHLTITREVTNEN